MLSASLWLLGHCAFEKAATPATLIFQIVVFTAVGVGLWFLNKIQTQILVRFGIVAVGVLIFELFTAPMWRNAHLGQWAYLYHDVSWILTIGWSIIFLGVVEVVDKLLPRWREWKRFLLYL